MSADNTIGILVTRRRDGQSGQEYRVAHVQAIENIVWEPDYPSVASPVFNREWVRRFFRGAQIYYTYDEAYRAAQRLEKKTGYVEYGICLLDYTTINFPASERKRRRRQRLRRFRVSEV